MLYLTFYISASHRVYVPQQEKVTTLLRKERSGTHFTYYILHFMNKTYNTYYRLTLIL